MQFRRLDSTTFNYDFSTGQQVEDVQPEQLIMDLSAEALLQHGIVEQAGDAVQSIRKLTFYSWWNEDTESKDLNMRVNVDSEVGGGLSTR